MNLIETEEQSRMGISQILESQNIRTGENVVVSWMFKANSLVSGLDNFCMSQMCYLTSYRFLTNSQLWSIMERTQGRVGGLVS